MVAKFKNTPHKNFTADFEVKEYGKKGIGLGGLLLKAQLREQNGAVERTRCFSELTRYS